MDQSRRGVGMIDDISIDFTRQSTTGVYGSPCLTCLRLLSMASVQCGAGARAHTTQEVTSDVAYMTGLPLLVLGWGQCNTR